MLDQPTTEMGSRNSKSTLEVGDCGETDAVVDGGAISVTTEFSMVDEESVSELQEFTRNMHESESAAAKIPFRMSVVAAFA